MTSQKSIDKEHLFTQNVNHVIKPEVQPLKMRDNWQDTQG